jgi:hypothetical protein
MRTIAASVVSVRMKKGYSEPYIEINNDTSQMLNSEQKVQVCPSTSLCSVFWVNLQQTIIRVTIAGIKKNQSNKKPHSCY